LRFRLEYDQTAYDDIDEVDAFDLPIIRRAIDLLRDQADVPTRNRRALVRPISWCPEATWQLRVRAYRVLYRFDGGTVRLLRVRWKGSFTTEEIGR
jgi:mRNA-degrading endonuclease RelE of RelBE toxin-antitoxin system